VGLRARYSPPSAAILRLADRGLVQRSSSRCSSPRGGRPELAPHSRPWRAAPSPVCHRRLRTSSSGGPGVARLPTSLHESAFSAGPCVYFLERDPRHVRALESDRRRPALDRSAEQSSAGRRQFVCRGAASIPRAARFVESGLRGLRRGVRAPGPRRRATANGRRSFRGELSMSSEAARTRSPQGVTGSLADSFRNGISLDYWCYPDRRNPEPITGPLQVQPRGPSPMPRSACCAPASASCLFAVRPANLACYWHLCGQALSQPSSRIVPAASRHCGSGHR